MILMWLGAVVFTVASLQVFRLFLSRCLPGLQRKFLSLPEPAGLFKMMTTAKLCSVSHGSFLQTQYSAVALMNSRSFSRHYGILLLCLSSAGIWTTMLGILLAWQVGGEIFWGLAFPLFLYLRWRGKSMDVFTTLIGLSGFLSGMQWVLQKQSILLSVLGESEFHFLLADGRFPAQLLWMGASFVLTLVIGIESWAVILALVMVVAGSLSLNGAVAFIIGEMLAHVWMLWWRSRKLNQDVVVITKAYALANTVGLGIAFFAAGLLRNAFAWTFTFEGNQLTEKSWQFFGLYFLIVVTQSLVVLLWGHFAAKRKIDEVQKGEYFSIHWISQGLISRGILDFILKKLNQRLDVLTAQQKELDAKDRAKIPAAFLKDHEHEMTQLALWLPLAAQQGSLTS